MLNHASALHKHAAGTRGGVEHNAPVRLQHMGNERDQRYRRKKFAAIMRVLCSKAGQKVFVDAPEDIARDRFQLISVERAQQLTQNVVLNLKIFDFGQHAAQVGVVGLDGVHGGDNGLGPTLTLLQRCQIVELRFRFQVDGALAGKILLGERTGFAPACRQSRFKPLPHCQKAAIGMTQKNQPHDRQKVLVTCIV